MPSKACPYCSYTRSWKLRREKAKCKRCRREFSVRGYVVSGVRATEEDWRRVVASFLRERAIRAVAETSGVGYRRAQKMLYRLRVLMSEDRLPVFSGTVELDETYIGGQRKNQCLHIRRLYPPKRGHGTQKLPIFGIFHRGSGKVFVGLEPKKLDWRHIIRIVDRKVAKGSRIYTDGFPMYEKLRWHGYAHRSVDHNKKEYVRGDVHTNGIEGFWGIMKRRMGCIGGMRRDRLMLFAGEIAWRFNHRRLSREEKERALMELVLES
jgi:transposase